MKINTVSTIVKNTLLVNILAVALLSSQQVKAGTLNNDNDKKETSVDTTKASNKFNVKYLGATNDVVEFDVQFNNSKGSEFTFVIRDEAGDILFEKDFSDKLFNKKVQISTLPDYGKLTFNIIADNKRFVQSKEITIQTRYIENMYVKID
ncbi:MAG: hypothetical protein ACOVNY_07540 [Chitinophagaceae bacterium]|jgi:hypothetical protein